MSIKNQLNLAVWLRLPADLLMYLVIPNTKPAIDAKSQVEYIVQKSRSLAVSVHPIGAVTKNAEGKELAEMYDMKTSGAIAFGDGLNCIQSAGLL